MLHTTTFGTSSLIYKKIKIAASYLLLVLTFYSSVTFSYQNKPEREVQQSLLKKLQAFALNSGMQVPANLQDKQALIKLSQKVAKNRIDLGMSPEETQMAMHIMQSLLGQQKFQIPTQQTGLMPEESLQQRIAKMAEGGKNPIAMQMMAALKEREKPSTEDMQQTINQKNQQQSSNNSTVQRNIKNSQNLIAQQAAKVSEQAGKAREKHVSATYANLSPTGKLEVMLDAKKAPTLSAVKNLVAHGADVNKISELTKQTSLHLAAKHGHLQIVKYLVGVGSTKSLRNWKKWTPAQLAEGSGHIEVAKFLDPNKSEKLPRYYLTRSPLVGVWQSVNTPTNQIRFRKDKTILLTSSNSADKDYSWDFDRARVKRKPGEVKLYVTTVKSITTVSDQMVIQNVRSPRGYNMLLEFRGKQLYYKMGDELYDRQSTLDEDMDYVERTKDMSVDLKYSTR